MRAARSSCVKRIEVSNTWLEALMEHEELCWYWESEPSTEYHWQIFAVFSHGSELGCEAELLRSSSTWNLPGLQMQRWSPRQQG